MRIITCLLCAVFFFAGSVSCSDDAPATEAQGYRAEGATISLDLTANAEEGFRTLTYDVSQNEGLPILELPAAGSEVPVVVMIRKEGDPASMTYAELKWVVQADGKTLKYKGDITLAKGSFMPSDNGKWFIMAAIGAEAENIQEGNDISQARLKFSNTQLTPVVNGKLNIKMPYLMSWTPLEITKDKFAENFTLKFYPQGSLVRYQLRSNMVDDYTVGAVRVASEAFYSEAYCDISPSSVSDSNLKGTTTLKRPSGDKLIDGVLPLWKATTAGTPKRSSTGYTSYGLAPQASSGLWSYDLWNGYADLNYENFGSSKPNPSYYYSVYRPTQPITLASGAQSEAYYAWVMPTASNTHNVADQPETEFYLEVTNTKTQAQTLAAVPAHRSQKPIKDGAYYKVYPVLTSDLIISEVMNRLAATLSESGGSSGSGGGAVGPGAKPDAVLSLIELYNPTLDPIDLSDYALARSAAEIYSTPISGQKLQYYVHASSTQENSSTDELSKAQILPLRFLETKNTQQSPYANTKFAAWKGPQGAYGAVQQDGQTTTPKRFVVLAGQEPSLNGGKLLLQPGKTLVIAMGSWLALERSRAEGLFSSEEEALVTKTQAALNQAVTNGYLQYAVAYSDAYEFDYFDTPFSVPYTGSQTSGVLSMGNGIGFFLIKGQSNGTFAVIDTSMPDYMSYGTTSTDPLYIADRDSFWSRYEGSVQNDMVDEVPSVGHTRHPGSNHANVRPLYTPVSPYVYPYSMLWMGTKAEEWTPGVRSSSVNVSTPLKLSTKTW